MADDIRKTPDSRANLAKVAERAGVSSMTVSRVINQPGKVADTTRAKVEAALDALGYVPNLAANTLRQKRSGVIVAMVPTVENSIFSDTIQGISNTLEVAGYQLLLGCTSYDLDKEEKLTRAFLGRRPDGIILTGTLHNDATRTLLENAGIPIVEMWDLSDQQIDSCVGFDNFQAGFEIAQFMLSRGYKNVGYVAPTLEHEALENRAAKRSAGIYSAFEKAGRSPPRRQNVRTRSTSKNAAPSQRILWQKMRIWIQLSAQAKSLAWVPLKNCRRAAGTFLFKSAWPALATQTLRASFTRD